MKAAPQKSSFAGILAAWPAARLRELIDRAGPGEVERALGRESLHPEDLAALLSPAAVPFLEDLARRAQRLTRQYFESRGYRCGTQSRDHGPGLLPGQIWRRVMCWNWCVSWGGVVDDASGAPAGLTKPEKRP